MRFARGNLAHSVQPNHAHRAGFHAPKLTGTISELAIIVLAPASDTCIREESTGV